MSPAGSCARAALDRRVVRCSCAAREANCGGNDREIVVLGRIHLLAVSGFESGDSGGWLHPTCPKRTCAHVVFASRRREQGASAGGGGEQHLRARLWLAVDVRRHLLLVLVARAPLPPRSRHTKEHLPSEWMRVRMSDLDTALEGAHADVSGGTGACAGQRAAAATWCEEAARSPRPPLFLPAGGLLGPK